jgi:hypothetical protein
LKNGSAAADQNADLRLDRRLSNKAKIGGKMHRECVQQSSLSRDVFGAIHFKTGEDAGVGELAIENHGGFLADGVESVSTVRAGPTPVS